MTERRQDLMVGVFMLAGIVALGAMVVAFGEAPEWLLGGRRYEVLISFTRLSDVQEGTAVRMRGIEVGRVKTMRFKSVGHPEEGTYVVAQIDSQYVIPKGSTARVRPAAIGFGRSDILIEVPTPANQGFLPKDGNAMIPGEVGSPLDSIIPERVVATLETATRQIGELAKELTPVANDLHMILQVRSIRQVETTQPAGRQVLPNLYTAVERLYRVLTHFDTVLGDPAVQSNIKVAVANFKDVSDELKIAARDIRAFASRGEAVGDKLEKTLDVTRDEIRTVGQKLADNSDRLAAVFDNMEKATRDMAEGQGTLGMLLRDPKLYDELLLTTQRLRATIEELNTLVKKLQDKGLFSRG